MTELKLLTLYLFTVQEEAVEETVPLLPPTLPQPTWQLSQEQLFSSKDIFAKRILSQWGITNAAGWEAERAKAYNEDIISLPVQKDRVQEWLSTNLLDETTGSIFASQDSHTIFSQSSQPMNMSQTYGSTHRFNVAPSQGNLTLTQPSEFNESQDITIRKQNISRSSAKRRRTDGF